ncbi:uncharacterized protein LOC125275891 isoform X2 [Megalobrama amblycephala]|nr:uncharacterized protein LOC125275891 isoform X2 [Megalobrama amblycephala]
MSYQCISNCTVSKVCPNPQDVCIAVWWRQDGIVTMETRCHDPTQPLRGVMLEDYSSSDCVLTIRHASGHNLRLCACTGRDCNERMVLNKPSEDSELVIMNTSKNKLFRLPQLCKFCDFESTECNATGVCESSCSITSVCEDTEDVCASAWRRSEGKTLIETVCHNPALKFHGQYLTDYNNTRCEMKKVKGMEDFYICSCNAEGCNDRLFFPGVNTSKNKLFRLPQLCKFCDFESTECNATGVCESSCSITSICEDTEDVCASAWRRSEGKTLIETVCHNPALKFHGQYLTDYNNTRCEMKKVKGMEDFYICSCNAEECNDRLFFPGDSPGDEQKKLPPLLPVQVCLKRPEK